MIRALVDPAHLRPTIEIETCAGFVVPKLPGAEGETIDFAFDAVTVRKGDLSGELDELEITIRGEAPTIREGLVEAVEERVRHPADPGRHGSARTRTARPHDAVALEQDVRAAREVAVIAHSQGRIALCRKASRSTYRRVTAPDRKPAAGCCASVFGRSLGRIRLLGTAPGMEARPGLEVWLAEGVERRRGVQVAAHRSRPGARRRAAAARCTHAVGAARRRPLGAGCARAVSGNRRRAGDYQRCVPDLRERRLRRARSGAAGIHPGADVPPELLLNPELSRLAFDERILVIAEDPRTPLLERVRFLSMFGTRLDDFFTTRIAEFKKAGRGG
jgi:hypothetical protein